MLKAQRASKHRIIEKSMKISIIHATRERLSRCISKTVNVSAVGPPY